MNENVKTKLKNFAVGSSALGTAIMVSAVPVLAEESASSITSTLTSSFTSIANDVMSMFSSILPVALPIVGAGLVISLGIRIFYKVTHH